MEVLPKPTYNDLVQPRVETYPPYVKTHVEPVMTNQIAQQNEPKPVMNVHPEAPTYNDHLRPDVDYPTNYNHVGSAMEVLPKPTYNDHVKPHVETYPPYVNTHLEPVMTNQIAQQNEPKPLMNLHPEAPTYNDHVKPDVETNPPYVETHQEPVPTSQVAPQNEAKPRLNGDPKPVPNKQVTPQYEAQPRMNADPEPVPNNQDTLQNKLQPFMEGKVTQDPDPAHMMQPAPVEDSNEPIQMMQDFESTPMKETLTGQN